MLSQRKSGDNGFIRDNEGGAVFCDKCRDRQASPLLPSLPPCLHFIIHFPYKISFFHPNFTLLAKETENQGVKLK